MSLECPALFVPVKKGKTGTRGAFDGTTEEAYSGADREGAHPSRSQPQGDRTKQPRAQETPAWENEKGIMKQSAPSED
jgi:hypothetical protein